MGQAKIKKNNGVYFGQSGYVAEPVAEPVADFCGSSEFLREQQRQFGQNFIPPEPTACERRTMSIHEAGHAVMYALGGLKIDYATSRPAFDNKKRVWVRGLVKPQDDILTLRSGLLMAYIKGVLAGLPAVQKANDDGRLTLTDEDIKKQIINWELYPASESDWPEVIAIAKNVLIEEQYDKKQADADRDQIYRLFTHQLKFTFRSEAAFQKLLTEIEDKVRRVFEIPEIWDCVIRVAVELEQKDKLNGVEIDALISQEARDAYKHLSAAAEEPELAGTTA
jgi:hypothetical protein